MTELVMLWSVAIVLWISVAVQIADYKKRKVVSAELQRLIELIKGEQE